MDAIVLAGGYATRLWPITRHRPKMFLPIGESTVIDRIFEELEADDRIDRVFVSTNERFAADFREFLAERSYTKPTLSIEESTAEDEKLGVVGALAQLVEREAISSDTLVIAGDNLLSFSVGEFLDVFQENNAPTIAAYDVESTERASQYGVLDIEDNIVVDFEEKPDRPESTRVSIACYGLPARALSLLEEYLSADNNPDEPGWFIQWLVNRETVYAFSFEDAWFDIGTPESYLDAVEWHLDGGTLIEEGATVERSTLGATVHVMAGATVTDSHLERTIVFPDATVRSSDVRSSIIDNSAIVENLDLAGAQIGPDTQIQDQG